MTKSIDTVKRDWRIIQQSVERGESWVVMDKEIEDVCFLLKLLEEDDQRMEYLNSVIDAWKGLCEHQLQTIREFTTPEEKLQKELTNGLDECWEEYLKTHGAWEDE